MSVDVGSQAAAWATELESTITSTLRHSPPHRLQVSQTEKRYVVEPLRSTEAKAYLPLCVDGEKLGELGIEYQLTADSRNQYLKVHRSKIEIRASASREPILRLEYEPVDSLVPASQWHIHAENGALSAWLALAHKGAELPRKRWAVSSLHLPTGGERMRPALEDVLQLLIVDLRVDAAAGWQEALERGRERWRRIQLGSMVRDRPEVAADVLRGIGYTVNTPEPAPVEGGERFTIY